MGKKIKNKSARTAFEIIKSGKLENDPPVEIRTLLPENTNVCVGAGNTVSLGGFSDFDSIEKVRKAVDWLVDQLGGKVKWEKIK